MITVKQLNAWSSQLREIYSQIAETTLGDTTPAGWATLSAAASNVLRAAQTIDEISVPTGAVRS
jgi:hypothetical protein